MNKQDLLNHYQDKQDDIQARLEDFKAVRNASDEKLFEELAFCIFAANSSADMGMKAVELLQPVMHDGSLSDYKDAVEGKVRFYNVRSEYLHHNKKIIEDAGGMSTLLQTRDDTSELRLYLKDTIKGLGMKESSHYLRNIGYFGLCILDKHVRRVLSTLNVFKDDDRPSTVKEYEKKEQKMKLFADEHDLCIDTLDLAVWSYKTGTIQK